MSHASWCFACIGRREPLVARLGSSFELDGTLAHEVKAGFVAFRAGGSSRRSRRTRVEGLGEAGQGVRVALRRIPRSGSIGADPRSIDRLEEHGITTSSTCPERGRVKYEDMTESEAAAAFEEFMARGPPRDRLHELLAEQGLDPSQVLDDSLASLRVVQEALCPMLRLRSGPRTRPTEGPTWARYDIPPRVDVASSWIIDAAVSYFSTFYSPPCRERSGGWVKEGRESPCTAIVPC